MKKKLTYKDYVTVIQNLPHKQMKDQWGYQKKNTIIKRQIVDECILK